MRKPLLRDIVAAGLAVSMAAAAAPPPSVGNDHFTSARTRAQLAGIEIPHRVRQAGHDLELAACGVRDTLWITHFVSSYYVPPGLHPQQAALDPASSKLLRVDIVNSNWLPEQIPQEYREPLREELAADPFNRLRQYYENLSAGDVIEIFYRPEKGVTISVNGRRVAGEPGHDLIEALLRSWSDPNPVPDQVRRLLRENPC